MSLVRVTVSAFSPAEGDEVGGLAIPVAGVGSTVAETACTCAEALAAEVVSDAPVTAGVGVLVVDGGVDVLLDPVLDEAGALRALDGEDAAEGVLTPGVGDDVSVDPVEDGVEAALLDCEPADEGLDFESPDDAAVLAAVFALGWVNNPDKTECFVLGSPAGVVALLDWASGCALFAGPAAVAPLLLEDEEPSEPPAPVPSAAWATPAPLAIAAPTPSVMALAPSQAYGTTGRAGLRCRPLARRDLREAAECDNGTPPHCRVHRPSGSPVLPPPDGSRVAG